jgi:hypothetical protein
MRSNRRRNWLVKRIALGLAIAAFAAPVAQAKIDEGSSVQANGYQAFVTDFPSSQINASDYGMPRALPSDYALASRDVVRADLPWETVRSVEFGMPRAMPSDYALASREVVRADPPGQTVSDIGNIGEPQVVAAGFDWSDGAIGAGLALGLVLLGWGAALAARHLGRPQTA